MEKVVLLTVLILECIAGPLIQQQSPSRGQSSQLLTTAYAVDISTKVPYSAFQCIYQNTYKLAFIRAYYPYNQGEVDPNVTENIFSAESAGLGIEAYMVPQPKSNKSGSVQFDEMVNNLEMRFIDLNSVWIQVTKPSNWFPTPKANINFLNDIFIRASLDGMQVGVFTNKDDWTQITNGAKVNNAMLWYWSVEGPGSANMTQPDFNDFTPFAGWTAPSVKQFVQSDTICGVTLNRNVYDTSIPVNSLRSKEKSDRISVGNIGLANTRQIGRPEIKL
ncbi:hypothetical protein V3C99_013602 [Haemonchus contortus]